MTWGACWDGTDKFGEKEENDYFLSKEEPGPWGMLYT